MNVPAVSLAVAAVLVAALLLPALSTDDQLAPEPGGFEPVASVSSLMTGMGKAFSHAKEQLAEDADPDRRLNRLSAWSEVLAELSNVNTLHGPAQAYRDMAADTRRIALELAQAARADTVDELQLVALVGRLDVSCETCHDADF